MARPFRIKRLLVVAAVGTALALGPTTSALADDGGEPNARSCGGIGRQARDLAANEGPVIASLEGDFTCDDVGESHASDRSQGF